jgi:hypothetical protein
MCRVNCLVVRCFVKYIAVDEVYSKAFSAGASSTPAELAVRTTRIKERLMSQPETPRPSTDDLQFTTAESGEQASGAAVSRCCLVCQQPIVSTYYALGDNLVCPECHAHATAPPAGSRMARLLKASLLGLGAGLVGATIWFAVRRVAHIEVGLIAILVGFMVGKAVRRGSGGQGGRAYQVLAVIITYCCISANYMPDIIESVLQNLREKRAAAAQQPEVAENPAVNPPAAAVEPVPKPGPFEVLAALVTLFVLVFALAAAAPFLAGFENVIGLLIIGFALWEAWKFNARRPLPITGPYELAPPHAA